MKFISVATMREVERQADAAGLTYAEMMQRAGKGLGEFVDQIYGSSSEKIVFGLVGPGNNGGDVLVALAILAGAGWETIAYLSQPRPAEDILMINLQMSGCQVLMMHEDQGYHNLDEKLEKATVMLDGLLGTGFEMPLKPELAGLLTHIGGKQVLPHIVAVDCPSAVNCDTGEAAPEVLRAEVTVCMAAVKKGLLQFPAYKYAGQLVVVDLGFSDQLPAWKGVRDEVITEGLAAQWLPDRPLDGHKGTFGSTILAVGSVNYTGAALLAGRAALRSGVGLVKMAIPGSLHSALAGHLPEATWLLLPHELGVISANAVDVLIKEFGKAGSLLVGCGWGREETTAEFLRNLLTEKTIRFYKPAIGFISNATREIEQPSDTHLPPMVIDADGLRLLAGMNDWKKWLTTKMVLTPHPGELAELCGLSVEEIQRDRLETARRLALEWGVVLVLKGALTIIASPSGELRVVQVATTALSHGGTGDVLAGLIAGLLGQGMPPVEAAGLGCYLHAQAGLVAEEWTGYAGVVTAGDVVDAIGEAFQHLAASKN